MTYFGHCLGADIAAYFGNLVAVLLAFLLGIISLVLASIVGLGMYWGLK
jgi:hypothetical protein